MIVEKKFAGLLIQVIFFAVTLVGCESLLQRETTPMDFSAHPEEVEEEYHINSKDTLEVTVYPDEGLNREVSVNRSGTISVPLLGEIQVRGISVGALEKKMTALLKKDYLVDPQVHIRVKKYHVMSISILGEVRSPGPYELESEAGGTTLLEAIAKAGGFSQVANVKKIKIIRMEGGEKKVYKVSGEEIIKGKKKDVPLKANDIIVVEQSWF